MTGAKSLACCLLALGACDSMGTISLVGDDAAPRPEPEPEIDAPPDARLLQEFGVPCDSYVRTVQYPDGHRIVTTNLYGTVAAVRPGDDFTIERCGLMVNPSPDDCPTGATCTGASQPMWSSCERSYKTGLFMNQRLLIYCGQTIETFAANGMSLGSSGFSYFSIKVIY